MSEDIRGRSTGGGGRQYSPEGVRHGSHYQEFTIEKGRTMSKQGVMQVLTRAAEDKQWGEQIPSDPSILDEYDLTDDEKAALMNKDHEGLEAVGVDQRHTRFMAMKPTAR
jgi:hypothetical protein